MNSPVRIIVVFLVLAVSLWLILIVLGIPVQEGVEVGSSR